MEKYRMTYCEEIHPREREIPPPYVDPNKPGRRRYKRRREVGESFPSRKNKCSIASYSLKDLVNVRLRVLNQVANEPSVYQKVTLVYFPYRRWSIVQEAISFLEMCKALGNLEALYRKGMVIFNVFCILIFFNHNDPNALGMINQAADGGHIGASYVLAIILIFKGGDPLENA
ncbi:hypothetical protein H5410_036660 [Solanum commersonii]|uniref:At2g35280-like TPR domain-containing protein n=1 Tax=Solanum commersonii TaxID=4109 RepID=A0A9J5Y822_SOLCO|nr:hypothetical protein H5410_036660 [Solanum commersonii]